MSIRNRQGISLLEVVVGMTIIGFAVSSALSSSTVQIRATAQAIAVAEANALAEMKLIEALLELERTGVLPQPYPSFEPSGDPLAEYEWRVMVRGPSTDGLVHVSATVRSNLAMRTLEAVHPWPAGSQP
jgi:type II secretory pathway pseudopilin PulG